MNYKKNQLKWFFTEHKKLSSKLSNIKSNNALLYILASIHAKEQRADDAILLNEKNNIVESTNANLFLVKRKMYTPPLTDGPLDGTLRSLILKYFIVEERSLSREDYEVSEEIFLTNAHGVRFVKEGVKAKEIVRQLNSLI